MSMDGACAQQAEDDPTVENDVGSALAAIEGEWPEPDDTALATRADSVLTDALVRRLRDESESEERSSAAPESAPVMVVGPLEASPSRTRSASRWSLLASPLVGAALLTAWLLAPAPPAAPQAKRQLSRVTALASTSAPRGAVSDDVGEVAPAPPRRAEPARGRPERRRLLLRAPLREDVGFWPGGER